MRSGPLRDVRQLGVPLCFPSRGSLPEAHPGGREGADSPDAPGPDAPGPGVAAPGTDSGGTAPSGPEGPAATGEGPAGGAGDGAGSGGSSGGDGNGGCFKPETLVATAVKRSGEFAHQRIDDLNTDDELLGVTFDTAGNPVLQTRRILKRFDHEAKNYPFSEVATERGAKLVATSNHPLVTDALNNRTPLERLTPGQRVVIARSQPQWDGVAEVTPVGEEVTPVFNLKTETANYLVSQDGANWILVHNQK